MCELIFLIDEALPDPELDSTAFCIALREVVAKSPLIFDPTREEERPWIDFEALTAHLALCTAGHLPSPLSRGTSETKAANTDTFGSLSAPVRSSFS